MKASSRSFLLVLFSLVGASAALLPLLELVQEGLLQPAAERSRGEVLRSVATPVEGGVLPEGENLIEAPLLSESGVRMLFHTEGPGGGENLFLWEEGAGLRRLPLPKGSFLFSLDMDGAGSKVVFFSKKSVESTGFELQLWEEGVGLSRLIDGIFEGGWKQAISSDGDRIAVLPTGEGSVLNESTPQIAALGGTGLLLTQNDDGGYSRASFAESGKFSALRLESGELTLFQENEEDKQRFGFKRLQFRRNPDVFDVNGDRAEDLLTFEASGSSEPFWRAFALTGFSSTARSVTAAPAYTASWRAGVSAGVPVPGDYNGDGILDLAVYVSDFYPGQGGDHFNWLLYYSEARGGVLRPATEFKTAWGFGGMKAVPADYDGDGATDIAVFAPGSGRWHILYSRGDFNKAKAETAGIPYYGESIQWGLGGDCLLPADYNGDGCADLAVLRPGLDSTSAGLRWWIQYLPCRGADALSEETLNFGKVGDIPIPADFNGDGKSEAAVYRPSSGEWLIRVRADKIVREKWQVDGAMPLAADFDGDRKADPAFFSKDGEVHWQLRNSTYSPKLRRVFPYRAPTLSKIRWGSSAALPVRHLLREHQGCSLNE